MKRKSLRKALASLVCATIITQWITPVYADVTSIKVEKTKDTLSVGNEYLKRKFTFEEGKLSTKEIVNLRGDETFIPNEGSEEFIIKLFKEKTIKPAIDGIDRSQWTAKASSQQNDSGNSDGPASNLIDGNLNSIWHSSYSGTPQKYPHWVEFDLQEETLFILLPVVFILFRSLFKLLWPC